MVDDDFRVEVLRVIARVRRAMPRNVDVMQICDQLEAMMTKSLKEVPENISLPRPSGKVVSLLKRRTKK